MLERTISEILTSARKRIESPKHWCQKVLARNSRNLPVAANGPEAVSWCAEGSLMCEDGWQGAYRIICDTAWDKHGSLLHTLNDKDGHAAVLALYDETINAAKAAEAETT